MSEIVGFDVSEFRAIYTTFSSITDAQLQYFFAKAEMRINNTVNSCVPYDQRKVFLYLLVAHMAELQSRINAGNGNLVGNISSATQGSTSIGVSIPPISSGNYWYMQTPYGAEYWDLTKKYRSALYVNTAKPMPVDRNDRFPRYYWGGR